MPRWFTKLSIRTRLLIIFLSITTVAILIFVLTLLTQFRARAIDLTEDVIRGDLRTVLMVAADTVNGDDVQALQASGGEDSTRFQAIRTALNDAADLLSRSQAVIFVGLPTENNAEFRMIVSTSPERIEEVWDSAETIMAEAEQPSQDAEAPIHVQAAYLDETAIWASGFMPLRNSAGELIGVIGSDVRGGWVFNVRNEVLKITGMVFLIIYPLVIGIIFYISGKLTQPLKKMIAAAETVEKGEPFKSESIADIQQYSDELGLMARVFSRMAVEVQAREAALKQQVKALEIQIDHAKRNKQVEEITESDFFKDLQRKKEQLRASTGEKKSESNSL